MARMLLLPGGTYIGSVALAHAGLHKIAELRQERLKDPDHPAPHTVAVLRDPALVPPSTLRGAALSPSEVFPDLGESIESDPEFFRDVDLVVETSGSTTGEPRRVGLSVEALIASVDATHEVLSGPGAWILALPAHHIAGAMVLLRSTVNDFPPRIVDTSAGFVPQSLLPAIRGAKASGGAVYLSLVPVQLEKCLQDDEVTAALATLDAILVGGQAVSESLLERAKEAGLSVKTSYGMSETCGGVVYDGVPLPGTSIDILDPNEHGEGRIIISGPTLMTRYLDGESPWIERDKQHWLLTGDWGKIVDGTLKVQGRVDDVIITGGKNILPGAIEESLRTCEGVRDALVCSLPDSRWGNVVAALVQTAPDWEDGMEEHLYEHVAQRMGKHAAPRVILGVDELPVRHSGKVDRHAARQQVLGAMAAGNVWKHSPELGL